jgi:FkbM family methyltransferase
MLKPPLTVEIGAFDARFSAEMRRRGIKPIAFEANPASFGLFRHMVDREIEYLHLAVTDHVGTVAFQIQTSVGGEPVSRRRGDNSLLRRSATDVEYEEVQVPCTSLDAFFHDRGLQEAEFSAWIDVEGAVREVLLGADAALARCLALMIEVEDVAMWSNQWLSWQVFGHLLERGFVPVARDFEYPHQFNTVLLRNDVFRRAEVRDALERYFVRVAGGGRSKKPDDNP